MPISAPGAASATRSARSTSSGGRAPTVAYPDECWHCGACMVDCPIPGAIDIRLPLPLMILHVESPTARPVVEYPEAVQVRGGM